MSDPVSSGKHFHLIVPVWGKTYTELFTDVCLPMLLTPGNLGVFDQSNGDQFVIVTTWADKLVIEGSASYELLRKMLRVEFVLIDGIINIGNSHTAMSECYAMAMQRECVISGDTYFVFLTPDSFWPDGTFRELVALSRQNIRVVMAGGLRLNSESMLAILKKKIQQSPLNPAIPIDELTRLALANLHQLSDSFNLLSKKGFLNCWPSHMYWINERDRQLIAHCFHLHPLMILAPQSEIKIGTTIDGEFLNNLPYRLDQYHVLINDFIAFELTPADRNWGQPLDTPILSSIVKFALLHANSRHWHFFGQQITLNVSPDNPIDPSLAQLISQFVDIIQRKKMVARLIQIFHLRRVALYIYRLRMPRFRGLHRLFRRFFA